MFQNYHFASLYTRVFLDFLNWKYSMYDTNRLKKFFNFQHGGAGQMNVNLITYNNIVLLFLNKCDIPKE